MSDITGKTIRNRYRVDSFVGRGGMAEVYKVWDNERGVHLAMKVLREDLAEDKLFMRRFAREAQTLAKLQHPNIVRFYGLEQDASLAFMLMDFVEGTTLRREIFNLSGPIEHERIVEVMRPACAALGYAHKRGVIHCDVKPGNIMLEQSGRVLIADFGIARLTDAATATMVGLGTPAYMAPELVRGKEPTPQSDVYSLGVILFEMLTGGERPFTGEQASITGSTSDKIRWEQATLDPPTPRRWNRELTEQQESLILKALDKDPAKRHSSTEDLCGDLDRVFGRSKGVIPREKLGEDDRDQRVRTPKAYPELIAGAVKSSEKRKKVLHHLEPSKRKFAAIGLILITLLTLSYALLTLIPRNRTPTPQAVFVLEEGHTPTSQMVSTATSTEIQATTAIATTDAAEATQEITPSLTFGTLGSTFPITSANVSQLEIQTTYDLKAILPTMVEDLRYEFSPDGQTIALASPDTTVSLIDTISGKLIRTLDQGDFPITAISWAPDGSLIAVGYTDGDVLIWDALICEVVQELKGGGHVNLIAWSPDMNTMATGSSDRVLRVWDLGSDDILWSKYDKTVFHTGVEWSPDGSSIALSTGTCMQSTAQWCVQILNSSTGAIMNELESEYQTSQVSWSPNNGFLIYKLGGYYSYPVYWLWNTSTWALEKEFSPKLIWSAAFAWSPDSSMLVMQESERDVSVLDTVSLELKARFDAGGSSFDSGGFNTATLRWADDSSFLAGFDSVTAKVTIWAITDQGTSAMQVPTQMSTPLVEYIEGKVLFEDDFELEPIINWWDSQYESCLNEKERDGGSLLQLNNCSQLRLGPYRWEDYRLEFDFKPDSYSWLETWSLAVNVRVSSYSATPGLKSYEFVFSQQPELGSIKLYRHYSPGDEPLGYSTVTLLQIGGNRFNSEDWNHVRIDAFQSELRLTINGTLVLQYSDEVIRSGKIMFSSRGRFDIDNVRVVELLTK